MEAQSSDGVCPDCTTTSSPLLGFGGAPRACKMTLPGDLIDKAVISRRDHNALLTLSILSVTNCHDISDKTDRKAKSLRIMPN